jgi:hypothetical protein
MASTDQIADLINAMSHKTTASCVAEAQRLHDGGLPATVATSIVLDATLMAAASFIKTAIFNGAVAITLPIEELLPLRLTEIMAMQTKLFQQLPDGSFDPVGLTRN